MMELLLKRQNSRIGPIMTFNYRVQRAKEIEKKRKLDEPKQAT